MLLQLGPCGLQNLTYLISGHLLRKGLTADPDIKKYLSTKKIET